MADEQNPGAANGGASSRPGDRSDEREVVSVKISADAVAGWRSFCAQNGISLTAMLEIVCLDLGAGKLPDTEERRAQLVDSARQIDRQRRSRSPRR